MLDALEKVWAEKVALKAQVQELEQRSEQLTEQLSERDGEILLLTHRAVTATEDSDAAFNSALGPLTGATRGAIYHQIAVGHNDALDEAIKTVKTFKVAADPNCVADAIAGLRITEVTHEINGPIVYHRAPK